MCKKISPQPLSTKVINAANESQDQVWRSKYNPLDPKAPKIPSIGEIKAVIPNECFERSLVHSMYFVLRDSVMAAALVYITSQVLDTALPDLSDAAEVAKWVIGWNVYAFWIGTIVLGLWVLAHECGHGAFSSSQTMNDIVGFIIHQALLVPYFAWQYTHAKHHRRVNHLTDGESHVPEIPAEYGLGKNKEREAGYSALHDAIGDGAFAFVQLFGHLVLGWPLYLIGFASTGRLAYDGSKAEEGEFLDHFRPNSRMFNPKVRGKVLFSTIGEIIAFGVILKCSFDYGFLTVGLWYWGPYTWINAWLVLYTRLQHTDPSVPQYGADEWTWVRGALSTIDRPYGIFDFFHHRIGSTHVAHHLFHEMPFYKADVATAAIKEYLEPMGLYNYDPTPWYIAAWRLAKRCHYIESTEGIQYYKSLEDLPRSKDLKKD